MKALYIALLVLIVNTPDDCSASQFYVSTSGSSAGTGSFSDPWDLQTAFNHPSSVQPNDTIWLRGGAYQGHFTSNLNGAANQYIYVVQYPNEQARIEDNRQYASGATLQVNGSWTIYKGFEITNSITDRTSAGSAVFRPMGLQVVAPNTKFINLIIHDVGHGFGFWKEAVDAEIYGCIIYNCGIANSPGVYSTHGHGIYTQNDTGIKTIKNNLIFNQFGFGLHAYPNPGNVNGYVIDGNTLFNNGILTNDTARYNNIIVNPYPPYTATNVTIQNNHTYDSKNVLAYNALIEADLFIGATDVNCTKLTVENNSFMGKGRAGVAILQWDSVSYQNNTSYYLGNGSAAIVLPSGGTYSSNSWDNNTYFGGAFPAQFSYQFNPLVNFSNWTSTTGFDASSSFSNSSPGSIEVFVQPNQYETGRANLIIYNWNLSPTVSVDLTASGLVDGQNYSIVDAQNYFGTPVFSGVFNASSAVVTVNLSGLTAAAANGMSSVPNTAPEFATFIVLPEVQVNALPEFNSESSTLKVYPNPATEQLHIELDLAFPGDVELEMLDLLGNVVYQINEKASVKYHHKMNTSQFLPGIYLIKVTTSSGIFVRRIEVLNNAE